MGCVIPLLIPRTRTPIVSDSAAILIVLQQIQRGTIWTLLGLPVSQVQVTAPITDLEFAVSAGEHSRLSSSSQDKSPSPGDSSSSIATTEKSEL